MARAHTQGSERDGSGPTTRRAVAVVAPVARVGGRKHGFRRGKSVNKLLTEYLDPAQ